ARSGSNLLVDYLDGLPGVQSLSEILNWRTRIGPRREVPTHGAIRHIRVSMQTLQSPLRGCKLFLSDLEDFRLTLEDLDGEFPDAKYIVLYRKSLAEQFVSLELARMTQQWILLEGQK